MAKEPAMANLILVLAIFSASLMMGISMDSLFFIIFPLMERVHCAWLNHLLFWPSLAISVWLSREIFYIVIKYLSVDDKAQEVPK